MSEYSLNEDKLGEYHWSHGLLAHEAVELDGPGSEDDHQRDEAVVHQFLAHFQRRRAQLLDVLDRLLHLLLLCSDYKLIINSINNIRFSKVITDQWVQVTWASIKWIKFH